MSDTKESPNIKKGKTIIIVTGFAMLAAALVICIMLLVSGKDTTPQTAASDSGSQTKTVVLDRGFVTEENADTMMSEMNEKVDEGMFECKMTTAWTFADGKSESPNAYVANVESNRNTLYFDVYDKSTEEKLYSSPMLPIGTDISNIKLDKELSAGEYDAVVMYTMVDENYEEVSSVGFNITISVLK